MLPDFKHIYILYSIIKFPLSVWQSNFNLSFTKVVVGVKADCLTRDPGLQSHQSTLSGSFSKGYQPVFTRVLEKTTENSERLGRPAQPRNEPCTSRLPVFEHSYQCQGRTVRHLCLTRDSNPRALVQQPASLTTYRRSAIHKRFNTTR